MTRRRRVSFFRDSRLDAEARWNVAGNHEMDDPGKTKERNMDRRTLWTGLRNLASAAGLAGILMPVACHAQAGADGGGARATTPRERLSIDAGWKFTKGDPPGNTVDLTYMVRPQGGGRGTPSTAPATTSAPATRGAPLSGIYPWILPTANPFVKDPEHWAKRPAGNLGQGVSYIAPTFDDSTWRQLDLPHDWGIEGTFMQQGGDGPTGRLPFYGVGWYRKSLDLPAGDAGRRIFLDVDGAMSYATVWLNGQFVGGWPYGYSSWRLDLTPYAQPGGKNVLAIRLDNPSQSSRWYPGGGIYRNVWLVKTAPVHVAQWGTYITTPDVSATAATISLQVNIDNDGPQDANVQLTSRIVPLDGENRQPIAEVSTGGTAITAGRSGTVRQTIVVPNPKLWSPQSPSRYVAVTEIRDRNGLLDACETPFGIRSLKFDANAGLLLNGEHVALKGVCLHHDLGALGAAFNYRAQQRQLELLQTMGCNAIRTSHNPPAPELLDLADQMGFLVLDELFDAWRVAKRPNDYSILFPEWSEPDLRALIRRDRNHPSVIMWSLGNEIDEQRRAEDGAAVARRLTTIAHEEDPTRPTTAACHAADPEGPFPGALDVMGINYDQPKRDPNIYAAFHQLHPSELVFGSETVSTVSSRGEYVFPVAPGRGAIARNGLGQDVPRHQMSSYDMYYPNWATTPDTEFALQDRHPFVGGEFVWTGFDYLGEPTPWDNSYPARSSYFGILDLAGFPKDRFYIYQAHWRPDLPMAHILPHWNWPDRAGLKKQDGTPEVTPVHVYTSGDEAELFLNGKSLGRKKKGEYEYRLRWDDVVYQPGELRVVAYKNGKEWAADGVKTTGPASKLMLKADRTTIAADGRDLSFVSLTVADAEGLMVPRSMNPIHFTISGPGEIVATDNGDPTDVSTLFSSPDRKAFNGLALAIVRAKPGLVGAITLTAKSDGLGEATVTINGK
jgi:beta-galactosidase